MLKVVGADGAGLRTLYDDGESNHSVEWSPDGGRLLFTCVRDVCLINADGTGVTNLTADDGNAYDRDADWSPDGTQIVFGSDRGPGHDLRLYVMDADGGDVRELDMDEEPFSCCPEPDW